MRRNDTMLTPPSLKNEAARLEALAFLDVLDTPPEGQFDDIVRLAAYVCGTPIALVSLIDRERQWFKARFGLDARETPRAVSFCGHAINQSSIFEVPDAHLDARFADNPLVVEPPHVRAYAGAPLITAEGFAVGTLCVIDHEPRTLTAQQRDALKVLSNQVMTLLESRRVKPLMQKVQGFLEHSPAAIVFKDRDGRFTHANRMFCDWMAQPLADIVGRTSSEIHDEPTAAAFGELDRQVARDGVPVKGENTLTFPDGAERRVSSIKFPVFDAGGDVIEVASIHTDVTKQHAAEETLRQAQRMEAVGQLTGGVAHDFNNLLTIVQGNLELLDTLIDSPETQRRIGTALRALDQGRALVRQLMSFARKQVLKPQVVHPAEAVAHINELLGRTLRSNIVVNTSVAADLPPVFVDPAQLEAALLNLTLNAQDAMPEGGRIDIEARIDGPASVRLAVRDTGTGIPQALLQSVLEPFFTTKPPGLGSGLGLSMVYGFAKQSGGDLTIDSTEGSGTTVALSLPIAPKDAKHTPHETGVPVHGRGRVLLVEDNEGLREMAGDMIAALGYQFDVAADGREALDLLSGAKRYDILFSDVMLPGAMNGRDLADRVRQTHPAMRIVLTSGYDASGAGSAAPGRANSQYRFLPKPYRMHDLSQALAADG
ncbi:MAG: PAS domain-containing protein [Alphaproteobacteria bacterium]